MGAQASEVSVKRVDCLNDPLSDTQDGSQGKHAAEADPGVTALDAPERRDGDVGTLSRKLLAEAEHDAPLPEALTEVLCCIHALTIHSLCVIGYKAKLEFYYAASHRQTVSGTNLSAHIGPMTTKTKLGELDDTHEGFTILEGNLRCAITEVKEHQRTMELILLAHGLLEAFPGAGLLRVEIRDDGIAVPVRLTDKPEWAAQGPATHVRRWTLIAEGRTLERTDIEGWILTELLEEISRDSDGTWFNRVDALPDIDMNYEDPNRLPKTEFDIDLVRTAALPVPVLGPITVTADRDDTPVRPETEVLDRLRECLIAAYPSAYKLYITNRYGPWEADDLVDSTGLGLRSGEPLGAEILPGGGYVAHAIALLAGYLDTLPREGNTVGILIEPIL